jgi:hypothetical protein
MFRRRGELPLGFPRKECSSPEFPKTENKAPAGNPHQSPVGVRFPAPVLIYRLASSWGVSGGVARGLAFSRGMIVPASISHCQRCVETWHSVRSSVKNFTLRYPCDESTTGLFGHRRSASPVDTSFHHDPATKDGEQGTDPDDEEGVGGCVGVAIFSGMAVVFILLRPRHRIV